MKTQLHIPQCLYLMLLFTILWSPPKSEGSSDLNVDSVNDPNTIASLPCSEKYLSQSYFGKHASLVDSDFQNFLAQKLPLGSCKALTHNLNSVVEVHILQRNLLGEGSHRHLLSSIKFHIQDAVSELLGHYCEAVVIERLPSGVFADPFELHHLVQRGVFLDAAVLGDTNLELPSALSNRSIVEVHLDIGHDFFSRQKEGLEVNIDLPLHARYPPLGESGYSNVEMNAPDMLIRCSSEETSDPDNCLWVVMPEKSDSNPESLVWRIPSGNKAHSEIVSAVTLVSALLSTLLIILAAIYGPSFSFSENLKHR